MEIPAFTFQMSMKHVASMQQAKLQVTFQKGKHYIINCNFIVTKYWLYFTCICIHIYMFVCVTKCIEGCSLVK